MFLSSNYDKRLQPIDSIKTYAHRANKGIVFKLKEIKCNDIATQ